MKKHEVEQELKKNNRTAWKDDGIVYVDRQIYIPNNKKNSRTSTMRKS